MTDCIYATGADVQLGVLPSYSIDMAWGKNENDFELKTGLDPELAPGSLVYIEETEWGGIIDKRTVDETGDDILVSYEGRTWHGILNEKVILPPTGQAHKSYNGAPREVIADLIADAGLGGLFEAVDSGGGQQVTVTPNSDGLYVADGALRSVNGSVYYSIDTDGNITKAASAGAPASSFVAPAYRIGDRSYFLVSAIETALGSGRTVTEQKYSITDGARISGRFDRYVTVWAGLVKELNRHGLRLDIVKPAGGKVRIAAVPAADFSGEFYSDRYAFKLEEETLHVNHLVCLGKGELTAREVVHLYADAAGNVSTVQTFFGTEERTQVYSNTNATNSPENADEETLTQLGVKELESLQEASKIDVEIDEEMGCKIGDTIGGHSVNTRASVTGTVNKIILTAGSDTDPKLSYEVGNLIEEEGESL